MSKLALSQLLYWRRVTQLQKESRYAFRLTYIEAVFFLSGRNLHPGPMHDSKFWKECHLLAPIVGFSHLEKTLHRRHALCW
jgi:hypothetical protein